MSDDTLDPMPPGPFVKIYGHIVKSSIWREAQSTRLLWITMLVMADANGYVRASVANLADEARISRPECDAALRVLESPDPDDRSGVNEGRRITRMQGGWHIENFRAYRELRTEKQMQVAERVKRHRERLKGQGTLALEGVTSVTVTPEGEGEGEEQKKQLRRSLSARSTEEAFSAVWSLFPARRGGNPRKGALKQFAARLRAGVSLEELSQGVKRYAYFVKATGKEGTEFVMQGQTFFGTGEHWREAYSVTGNAGASSNGTGKRADPEAVQAWHSVLSMIPAWQRREITQEVHKALPAKVRAGISAVGGFKRISETAGERLHFVRAEFTKAYMQQGGDE